MSVEYQTPATPFIARAAGNSRTDRIIELIFDLIPLVFFCLLRKRLVGAVDFGLFFRVMHFRFQTNLRNLQRFVAEPTSDLHRVEARA